jgi:hypothetical protein
MLTEDWRCRVRENLSMVLEEGQQRIHPKHFGHVSYDVRFQSANSTIFDVWRSDSPRPFFPLLITFLLPSTLQLWLFIGWSLFITTCWTGNPVHLASSFYYELRDA